MSITGRLSKLEQGQPSVLPLIILTFNKMDDGLYRDESGQPYTPAEFEVLKETRQIVVVQYGSWPPDGEAEA